MSSYTTTVKQICDSKCGLTSPSTYDMTDEVIKKAGKIIFKDYPIFSEEYRSTLNSNILGHYFMDEIGLETVGLWQYRLNQKMVEIMPYYNQLYLTTLWEIDPFSNMDYTVDHDGSSDDIADDKRNINKNDTSDSTTSNTHNGWQNGHSHNYDGSHKQDVADSNTGSDYTDSEDGTVKYGGQDVATTHHNNDMTTVTNNNLKTTDNYNQLRDIQDGSVTHGYNSTMTKDGLNVYNDTPQGNIINIKSVDFATNVTADNVSDKHTGTDTDTYNALATTKTGSVDHTTTGSVTTTHSGEPDTTTVYGKNVSSNSTKTGNSTSNKHDTLSSDVTGYSDTKNEDADGSTDAGKSTSKYKSETNDKYNSAKHNENEYLDHYKGRNGITMAQALKEYRETLINIDLMIIDDLKELFMCVY